ncbi:MAG TPA: hypothetical protein VEJ87_06430 [Acidimicrobiales bacterium]|nr:hypothetical protein [Acidimicrobiales bacterium]
MQRRIWFYLAVGAVLVGAETGFISTFSSASGLAAPSTSSAANSSASGLATRSVVNTGTSHQPAPSTSSFRDGLLLRNRSAVPTTTTTTTPTSGEVTALTETPPPLPTAVPPRGEATAYGCEAAIAYLTAYSAPGFSFECPGYADGHQAMTCVDDQPSCAAGEKLIAIAVPCAAAYMNEASNSWVLTGSSDSPIDPYGYCD